MRDTPVRHRHVHGGFKALTPNSPSISRLTRRSSRAAASSRSRRHRAMRMWRKTPTARISPLPFRAADIWWNRASAARTPLPHMTIRRSPASTSALPPAGRRLDCLRWQACRRRGRTAGHFSAVIDVPPNTGKVVVAEWDRGCGHLSGCRQARHQCRGNGSRGDCHPQLHQVGYLFLRVAGGLAAAGRCGDALRSDPESRSCQGGRQIAARFQLRSQLHDSAVIQSAIAGARPGKSSSFRYLRWLCGFDPLLSRSGEFQRPFNQASNLFC